MQRTMTLNEAIGLLEQAGNTYNGAMSIPVYALWENCRYARQKVGVIAR